MRSLVPALLLALPLAACSSTSMEFQEPDAGAAVVGDQPTFQVRTGEATKGGGKAGKARRADNGGSMSKSGGRMGVIKRGPNNGGSMSKSGGSAGVIKRGPNNGGSMSLVSGSPDAVAGQQMTGTVLSWYDHRGWGYIVPWDDSENVWFHHSELQDGYQAPRQGDIVCFLEGSRGTRGPQAVQVALC